MNQDEQNARDQAYMQAQQKQRDQDFSDLIQGQAGIATGSLYNQVGLNDHELQQRQERENAKREQLKRESRERAEHKAARKAADRRTASKAKSRTDDRPRSTANESTFFPAIDAWFDEYIGGGRRLAVNVICACLIGLMVYGHCQSAGYSDGAGLFLAGASWLVGLLTMRLITFAIKILTVSLILSLVCGACYGIYLMLVSNS